MLAPIPSAFDAASCVISQASPLLAPGLIFILCLAGAIGLILLLPGRGETPLRAVGGIVLIASGIIFAATLAKLAAGVGAYFWIFSAIAVLDDREAAYTVGLRREHGIVCHQSNDLALRRLRARPG